MAAGLQGKRGASASARRKAAVQAASNSLAKIATSRDEEIEKAAPHVTESQIKAPVPMEGKSAIDPYGKMLGNKVAIYLSSALYLRVWCGDGYFSYFKTFDNNESR